MILLCYGMPKSASSFVFQLALEIAGGYPNLRALKSLLPAPLQPDFVSDLDAPLVEIANTIPNDDLFVLKTHAAVTDTVATLAQAGRAKALVVIRDPYDIVASLLDVGVAERRKPAAEQRQFFADIVQVEDTFEPIRQWMVQADGWCRAAAAHGFPVFRFEQVAQAPKEVVQQLAEYLQCAVEPERILAPYLANKDEKILEFNRGVAGRGRPLLAQATAEKLKPDFDAFKHRHRV